MKGLTKVIVISACIGALNFIPAKGHCQDQQLNNSGLFDESSQNQGDEKNPESKSQENKNYKPQYHDDDLFGDSANTIGTTSAWQHIKDRNKNKNGNGMNSLIGGNPDDPGPDPDAPFDGGVVLLFLVALGYGYNLHRKYKGQILNI